MHIGDECGCAACMTVVGDRGLETLYDHQANVIDKTWNYAKRCETHKDEVMNAILGLTGESGECADELKKEYFHSPRPDGKTRGNLVKEMGDVLFYWLKLRDLFNISIEEIIAANREKLESRHPELGMVKERFGEGAIR